MTMLKAPVAPPIEWRSATVAEVHVSERLVDLVAVPYNEDAVVEYGGHLITESVLPGAFDGIDSRPGRVSVNRDHSYERTVGLARSFEPSRTEGLVATVRISPTALGDESLALAEDGVLSASVGMAVRTKDQRWSEGNRRRQIVRAFLDHIALVPNPAYAGAEVLAVRSSGPQAELWTPPPTPRVDDALAFAERTAAMLAASRAAH